MRLLTSLFALALALPSLARRSFPQRQRHLHDFAEGGKKDGRRSDGKIGSILKAGVMVKLPEGSVVVDGSGKYLIPGLAEMHGHIPPSGGPPASCRTC